jgi:ferredoxin
MNLLSFAERIAALDASAVKFDEERCLHTVDKGSTCSACFELCPVQAIQPGRPPVLDAGQCKSCLACLPACPVGAYQADDMVANLLASVARQETPAVELVCSLHPQPETGLLPAGIKVYGCLAGVGAGALMGLNSLGCRDIALRVDACGQCPWSSLKTAIDAQAQLAGQLLSAWDGAGQVRLIEQAADARPRALWRALDPPMTRRDLFRITAQGRVAQARTIENGQPVEEHRPGRERMRMLAAAQVLGIPDHLLAELPQAGDFAALFAEDTCTACGACERACPTGALELRLNEDKSRFQLVFYAQYCIGCGFCLRSCAPDALLMEGRPACKQVFATQRPVLLQEGALRRCDRCNTPFAAQAGAKLCPACQYRQSHPFGSKLPPGFKLPAVQGKDTPA